MNLQRAKELGNYMEYRIGEMKAVRCFFPQRTSTQFTPISCFSCMLTGNHLGIDLTKDVVVKDPPAGPLRAAAESW